MLRHPPTGMMSYPPSRKKYPLKLTPLYILTNVACCGGVNGCTADERPKRNKAGAGQRPKRDDEEEEEEEAPL